MQTLGKTLTAGFFNQEEGWHQIQKLWKADTQVKERREARTPVHYLLYAILRGKDFRKGFGPTKSEHKIKDNGFTVDHGLRGALIDLKSRCSSTEATLKLLQEVFPTEKDFDKTADATVAPANVMKFVLTHLPKFQELGSRSLYDVEPYSDALKVNVIDLKVTEKEVAPVPGPSSLGGKWPEVVAG